MKYVIAFLLVFLTLGTLTYFVLLTWGISLFDAEYMSKTYTTFGLLAVGAFVLTVIVALFFGGNRNRYDQSGEGVAQRKL